MMVKKKDLMYSSGAALVAALSLAAYINKAFFLDSYIYLVPAERILKSPMDPYNIDLGSVGNLFYAHTHPPLTSYLIAPVLFFGDIMKEWQVNSLFIALAGLTVFSFYYLSKGVTKHNMIASLFLATTPAFLLSFSQVNADPVTLAFWVLSAAVFLVAVRKGSTTLFIFSGVAAGLASLASFQALVILPLFAIYLIFKRYKNPKALAAFISAIAVFSIWCIENYVYYGHLQLFNAAGAGHARISWDLMGQKAFSALGLLGGVGLFPLMYIYAFETKITRYGLLVFVSLSVGAFVFAASYMDIARYTLLQKSMLIFFVTSGVLAVIVLVSETVKAIKANFSNGSMAEEAFFLLWFWTVVMYNILILPFESARYLLPAFVPLALVFSARIDRRGNILRGRLLKIIIASLAFNFILGQALLYADYVHANIYRDYARQINDAGLMDKKVFFDANWGFWFYLERRGAQRIQIYNRPLQDGDIYIRPVYTSPEPLSEELRVHLLPVREEEIKTWFPLRTLSKAAEAGYYSQVWGFLPYSFTDAPLDTISTYKYVSEIQRQTERSDNLDELYGSRVITQRFISKLPNIEGMSFEIGMYGRKCTGHLHFRLTDSNGNILAEKTIPLTGLEDGWIYIDFPPIKGALGKPYEISFSSPDSAHGNAAALFYDNKPLEGVELSRDGKKMEGSLAFIIFD